MPPWWILTIATLVILLVVAAWVIRRSPALQHGLWLPRLILALSLIYAAGTAAATVTTVIRTLVDETIPVTLPVGSYWPAVPPYVTITGGPTATVVSGGFTQADVMVSGLDTATRVWLAAGHLVQGAAFVVIGIAIALLCHRLIRLDPFRPTVAVATAVAAFAVGVGGLAWQACFTVGGLMASNQVLGVTSWETHDSPIDSTDLADFGWPPVAVGFVVGIWPIAVGLALGAVAVVLRSGVALQHETERLRRETAGLV